VHINPERFALLEKHGFFRFYDREDLSIAEFVNSECTVLEWWGLDLESVVKELGLLLAEWVAIVNFRSQLLGDLGDTAEIALSVFSERISGITFFGKYDPDFDRSELREVLYYVIYGQRWLQTNVCLFEYWTESCRQISRSLNQQQASHSLVDLRGNESRFQPIDGYSKYPRIGLPFWRQAVEIFSLRGERSTDKPTVYVRAFAVANEPLGNIYRYLKGIDVETFRNELCERGILSGPEQFIPRKNTFHKLTHILAMPYMLRHLGVIDSSFFECTQLERVDIYAASFSIRFGRNVLSDLAVTDFMTQLEKKDKTDVAWIFYNEISASVESSRNRG
jgi:hypothetical protein